MTTIRGEEEKVKALVALSLMKSLRTPALIDLLREHEDPVEALEALKGGGPGLFGEGGMEVVGKGEVEEALKAVAEKGIRVIRIGDPNYPALLLPLHVPPPILFIRGDCAHLSNISVAVVGTRGATPYGKRVARWLGAMMAREGIAVVSGMAWGIDTEAHLGALEAGGVTTAVLGTGVDIPYPRQNRKLMERIIRSGCVISEFPPGTPPHRWNFPQRNRIISGLSSGVVVVEAPEKSGALITSSFALEQGKSVFAVPGEIWSKQSRGPHSLLRDGAIPVTEAFDILSALGWSTGRTPDLDGMRTSPQPVLSDRSSRLVGLLGMAPTHVDEIAFRSGMPAAEVLSELFQLEMMGLVEQRPGKYFQLRAT